MLKLEVLGVSEGPHHPVVLLRHEDRILPIVVGIAEANAIQVGLMQEKIGRPMTHDLICNLLAGLGGALQSVSIYKLENDTFFAHLNVEQKNVDGQVSQILRIDSRPSDGIALAIRVKCPILAAEEVMDVAGQDVSIISPPDEPEEGDEGDFNE
jgi:hypothetical protein